MNERQAAALRRAERAWPGHHGSSIGIARDPGNAPTHLIELFHSFVAGSRDVTPGKRAHPDAVAGPS